MQTVQISAPEFFDLLKARGTSMWEIFAQMVDGKTKELIFLDATQKILFTYILPETSEQLEADRKQFAEEYANKLSEMN